MVQGLARSRRRGEKLGAKSTESETVPKQPTARPSTASTATWNYKLGLPCHSMALDYQKSKCYCMSFTVLHCKRVSSSSVDASSFA
jgi:hypothetical protein